MVANRRSPLRASARSASGTPKLRYGNGRRTEANVARTTRPRVQARRAASAESPRTVARTPSDVGIHAPAHDTLVTSRSRATPPPGDSHASCRRTPSTRSTSPRAVACSMATRSTPGGAQRRASARLPIATPTPAAAVAAAISARRPCPAHARRAATMTTPAPSTRPRAAVSGGSGTAPLTRQPSEQGEHAAGQRRHASPVSKRDAALGGPDRSRDRAESLRRGRCPREGGAEDAIRRSPPCRGNCNAGRHDQFFREDH